MVDYTKHTLKNGLRIIVNEDRSTPLVAFNILYDVGSRDENADLTGLAHLFEHLMFGGSSNIPEFDLPLQMAGGESNAFTNNDITNYYITIPTDNLETAFWLESDRMLELDFSQKILDTQKNVVTEEFKQRYLNQPYGDSILYLRPLAYKVHPYRWPTIGRDISHIENVDIEQVRHFFYSHYAPNNAILSITGNVSAEYAFKLAQKWFGPIGKRKIRQRVLPAEPPQTEARKLIIGKNVPATAFYKVWHIVGRKNPDFHTLDLITDLLSGGESGRLHTKLVRERKMFSEINAYISSDIDPGLIFVQGKLMNGIAIEEAELAVTEVIASLQDNLSELEMEKVKNKFESSTVFSRTNILNKAMNLAYFELLGNPDLINQEVMSFRSINTDMVKEAAKKYFIDSNSSTIYYKSSRRGK